MVAAGGSTRAPSGVPTIATPVPFDGALSVLTYNVHGLPWPLTSGRPAAFHRIAARLAALRADGAEPQVVVLQEAFTDAAAAIGREAGYRYIAYGPSASDRYTGETMPDEGFASGAHWYRGEDMAPAFGSGLVILSDYPIVSTARIAFPRNACAGYDCLANKGAVLARVAPPGAAEPIDIVTTHLNCRERTGVTVARADTAYDRQVKTLLGFIAASHDPRLPMIVAGDFNVGPAPDRQAAIAAAVAMLDATPALQSLVAQHRAVPADAEFSWHKNKDLQLAVSAPREQLRVTAVATPFGHEADGSMLSDHVGYVARYRVETEPSRLAQRSIAA